MAAFLEQARERAKALARQQAESFDVLEQSVLTNLSKGVDRLGGLTSTSASSSSSRKRTLEELSKQELLLLVKREMEGAKQARKTAEAAVEGASQAAEEAAQYAGSLKRVALRLLPPEERQNFEGLEGEELVQALGALPPGAPPEITARADLESRAAAA
eukprot:scaffold262322_cov22-Tisochrysis_lutea.AAC.1